MPRRTKPRDPEQVKKIVRTLRERFISPEAQAVAEREFRKLQFKFPGLSLDKMMQSMADPNQASQQPPEPTAEEIAAQEQAMQEANQMALLDALLEAPATQAQTHNTEEAQAAAILAALKGESGQSPGEALQNALNANSPVAGSDIPDHPAAQQNQPFVSEDGDEFSVEEQECARKILMALKNRQSTDLN